MSLGALIVLVAFAVTLLIGVVHYTGGSRGKGDRDHGEVILEFARAYPGEAIRSVTMTKDGNASFLRLGGDYLFNSPEDAAEVSLWLCGSFAAANAELDNPEADGNA